MVRISLSKLIHYAFVILLFTACTENPLGIDEEGSINEVTSILLASPASSPNTSDSITISIPNVTSGEVIQLYSNSSCSNLLQTVTASSNSVSFNVSGLSYGSHIFHANRISEDGSEVSPCSSNFLSYTRVEMMPILGITLVSPASSPSIVTTPTINFSGLQTSDNLFVYSDSNCTTLLATAVSSGTDQDITLPTLSIGTYTLYGLRQSSDNSLTSPCSSVVLNYEVVATPGLSPVGAITLVTPASSPNTNHTPTINVAGVASTENVHIYSDNTCSTLITSGVASSTDIDITLPGIGPGTYQLYAKRQSSDLSQESVCSSTFLSYEVLNLPEVTSINLLSPASVTSIDTDPIVQVTGVLSGETISLYSDASCSTLVTSQVSTGADINFNFTGLAVGSYDYYAIRESSDSVNQSLCSSATLNYTVVSNNLILSGLSDDLVPTQSKTWNWVCTGAHTTCEYRYVINSNPTHTFTTEPYSATVTDNQPNGDATYYIHVEARDVTVNDLVSPVITVSAILDNTPPLAPSAPIVTVPATSPSNNTTPTIDISGVTSSDTVTLYSDALCSTSLGNIVSTGTTAVIVSSALTEGSHQFYANTTDAAGNSSPCSTASANYDLDLTGPTFVLTSIDDIDSSNVVNYFITGTCSEEGQTINLDFGGTLPQVLTCSAGQFYTGLLDVSSVPDNPTLTVNISGQDPYGNTTNAPQTIVKDTLTQTVTIDTPLVIDNSNVTSYQLSGDCTSHGTIVDVDIDSINRQPICLSGRWITAFLDLSTLPDGAISITADHSTATQATSSTTKDLSSDTVTISNVQNITSINETNYILSGTCSVDTVVVNIMIGTTPFTPTCNGTSWSTGSIDVSAEPDSSTLTITADHGTATQASLVIQKNTLSPTIISFNSPASLINTVDLNWDVTGTGGFTVNDYIIQFRVSGTTTWLTFNDGFSVAKSTTVTGLIANTSYDFRVQVNYDTTFYSDWSPAVVTSTQPDNPLFNSPNKAMNVGGSTDTNVVAYYDNTNVTLNGVAIAGSPISAGQVVNITTTQFDVIDADKPIFTAGRRGSGGDSSKGNITWSPTTWAGKTFSFNSTRSNPQQLSIYAIEATTIELKQGATILDSATLTAGSSHIFTWSVYGSYQIASTGSVLTYHIAAQSGGVIDPKPLPPSSLSIIGFPSSSMRITSLLDSTNFNLYHSNSTLGSGALDKIDIFTVNPQGTSSLFQSESLLIVADQKVSGSSYADSNGLCAAPFLPTNLMKHRYAINAPSDYVAFASLNPGVIDVYAPGTTIGVDPPSQSVTLTRTGSEPNAPYKVRLGGTATGSRFVSTVPIAAWYHPTTDSGAADNDETILYGTDDTD